MGSEIVAAMKHRAATNEWRSYPHGELGFAHGPSEEETEAAEAAGVEIAGVDLMSVENWPYVIEANASPSFRDPWKPQVRPLLR